jgi:hypothetical protein
MNISSSVLIAPHVAVPQVMNSDAALNSVIISETKARKSHFHIDCYLKGHRHTVKTAAMVDSGATALFLDKKFADSQKMWQEPLEHPIRLYNIDGTLNEASSITHQVSLYLRVGDNEEKQNFYITQIEPEKVILGLPWLRHRNPSIDWQASTMHLSADQGMGPEPLEVEVMCIMANHMESHCLLADKVVDTMQDEVFCLAGFTYSQKITEKANIAKGKKTFEEMVPPPYRNFAKVFSEEESQHLPEHQPWDHSIDLEPDAVM